MVSAIANNYFRIESRHFVPLSPEHHLTPALSPTSWRRGRRNHALAIILGWAPDAAVKRARIAFDNLFCYHYGAFQTL